MAHSLHRHIIGLAVKRTNINSVNKIKIMADETQVQQLQQCALTHEVDMPHMTDRGNGVLECQNCATRIETGNAPVTSTASATAGQPADEAEAAKGDEATAGQPADENDAQSSEGDSKAE